MNTPDIAAVQAILRSNLTLMIQRVFMELNPGTLYHPNWHIEAIAYQLERCFRRDCKRLIITLPPRHLKSISTSIAFVAWALGHDPALRFLCVSYGEALANKLSEDTRRVLLAPWYQACFPQTCLTTQTQSLLETSETGYRLAFTPGGATTGFGADFIIMADIHKADDVLSVTKRESALTYVDHTLRSRLNDPENGVIIVIQQRLHEADLVGHLLEQGETWTHLNLPAIAEEAQSIPIGPGKFYHRAVGEVLHPALHSDETLNAQRIAMGERHFATQYQQRPAPIEGAIIDVTKLRYYSHITRRSPETFVAQAWDTAYTISEKSNWTVCITALVSPTGKIVVVDLYRVRLKFAAVEQAIYAQAREWHPSVVVVESAGAGQALVQNLLNARRLPIVHHRPRHDKVTRMLAETPALENGKVFLPKKAPWLECFLRELRNFPNGTYDDQVDALSLFLYAARHNFGNMHHSYPPYWED